MCMSTGYCMKEKSYNLPLPPSTQAMNKPINTKLHANRRTFILAVLRSLGHIFAFLLLHYVSDVIDVNEVLIQPKRADLICTNYACY